jgi:hypothetical protein
MTQIFPTNKYETKGENKKSKKKEEKEISRFLPTKINNRFGRWIVIHIIIIFVSYHPRKRA